MGVRTVRQYIGPAFWPTISMSSLACLWYMVARHGHIDPYLLPSPVDVAMRVWSLLISGELMQQAGVTVYRTIVGFALGVCVGALIGLWMGKNRTVEWFFAPLISIMFPTPKISFLPIFILWFGTFDLSKILMAAFICLFPVVSACHDGVKDLDKLLPWVGRNVGMSERRLFWKIVMPGTLPALLNGAEISLPFAFIAVTVAEMMTGGGGIGARMMLGARYADSDTVIAWVVTLAILGGVLTLVAAFVRRSLLRWHTEVEAKT